MDDDDVKIITVLNAFVIRRINYKTKLFDSLIMRKNINRSIRCVLMRVYCTLYTFWNIRLVRCNAEIARTSFHSLIF